MHYIINPWIFYFLSTIDALRIALIVFAVIFAIIYTCIVLFTIFEVEDLDKLGNNFIKWAKRGLITLLVSIVLIIVLPSKQTMLEMVTASYLTTENIDKAATTGKDMVDYITKKIVEMNETKK